MDDALVDVVVVGGGIGGLANACALARAGHSVRVLERAPAFGEIGAGLQLAPNATRVLREWGLLEEVLDRGVSPRRLVLRDAVDEGELTRLELDGGFAARYEAPYVVIHRGDLLDVLARACVRAGAELVPGCEVHDAATAEDEAVVSSTRGEHRARLVIVADGLHSRLRAGFSDDEPVCAGYAAYRGAFPVERLDLEPEALETVVGYVGPGCHLIQYPLRGGRMFNTVAVFKSSAYERGEADWGGPEELEAVFAGCGPKVRAGLKSLSLTRRWPMYDRLPIPNWINGRLVLTGDAAHPMLQYLAQGACQAIEDAHCLATELASDLDRSVALKRYEDARTARTAHVQAASRLWGDIWHTDGVGRLLRNTLFRQRAPHDYTYVDWLYGFNGA